MDILPQTPVAKVVVDLPASMLLFDHWNIDYCFAGHLTLADAVESMGLEMREVLSELRRLDKQSATPNWGQRSIKDLVAQLMEVHHVFNVDSLAGLRPAVTGVLLTFGPHYDFLPYLSEATEGLFANMERHMEMENEVIFPRFLALEENPVDSTDGFLEIMLEMEGDHAEIGDSFRFIREITANYQLPEESGNIFRALYSGLMELEKDMKVHIHLENNVLLPKVRQLLSR
ncbi:MAG: DUF542 domain-containing protein [Planctomycetes bacterium]|nr:DUF542 domain-containing protein [Planctomycetota bacterium]NQU50343.1 DUF542 domain-containing protein [Planctomycetota bacterium]